MGSGGFESLQVHHLDGHWYPLWASFQATAQDGDAGPAVVMTLPVGCASLAGGAETRNAVTASTATSRTASTATDRRSSLASTCVAARSTVAPSR